jgi:hypothetical protein
LADPRDQNRQQQNQDGAVIQRQQSVVDAFTRRQLSAQVFLNEIHQGHDHFHDQNGDHDHRPEPVNFQPAERQEQQGVERVAHAMELELVALRRAPGQPLRQFMVIKCVECAHRNLDGDQGPEKR